MGYASAEFWAARTPQNHGHGWLPSITANLPLLQEQSRDGGAFPVLQGRNSFDLPASADAHSPPNVAKYIPARRYPPHQHVGPHMPSYNKLNQLKLKTVLDTDHKYA